MCPTVIGQHRAALIRITDQCNVNDLRKDRRIIRLSTNGKLKTMRDVVTGQDYKVRYRAPGKTTMFSGEVSLAKAD